MKLHRLKRGDTIVEVLLAIAIVSAVLAGAYVTTNRSLLVGRDAQERSEALKLAEGQVERLKSLSSDPVPGTDIYNAATPYFCIDSTLTLRQVVVTYNSGSFTISYPNECTTSYYRVFVERVPGASPGGTVFIARTIWGSITGQSSGEVTVGGSTGVVRGHAIVSLVYRAYTR